MRGSYVCDIKHNEANKRRIGMNDTIIKQTITLNDLAVMTQMLKTLLDAGKITKAVANETAVQLATKNELSPIYLW